MNKFTYNFSLDLNSNSESELITALYLYGENVEVDANRNPIIPQNYKPLKRQEIISDILMDSS